MSKVKHVRPLAKKNTRLDYRSNHYAAPVKLLPHGSPVSACVHAKLLQSTVPALCEPMDCNPPDSSVHAVLQAGILEQVAKLSSRGPS